MVLRMAILAVMAVILAGGVPLHHPTFQVAQNEDNNDKAVGCRGQQAVECRSLLQ